MKDKKQRRGGTVGEEEVMQRRNEEHGRGQQEIEGEKIDKMEGRIER